MSDNKDKPSKSRKVSSKAPPKIVNFFSKPVTANDVPSASTSQLNERKRKIPKTNSSETNSSENEDPSPYAQTLKKDAEKISRIEKTKKVDTVISTFFQRDKNDSLSDFESPNKRMQIKAPPALPKKKVTRKRKQPGNQKATENRNDLETNIFEKVLLHHSVADGLSSDELQMAIALSRSLAETHGVSTEDSNNISSIIRNAEPSEKERIIRTTFQKFGFKKRDNNDYDYRDFFTNVATNKKWTSKFTALTRRSENMQKEKFKKKVKGILQISECVENLDGEAMTVYQVTSSYLQQFLIPESRTYNVSRAVMETKIGDFYTTHLVPVSNLRCGSMLKNWDEIPGRDISPERNILPSWDDSLLTLETNNEGSSIDPSETKRESTSNSKIESDFSDNKRLPNADVTVQSNEFQGDVDVMHVDIVAQIEERSAREQSPDMFAEFNSSASNSFNDDKSITNQNESFASISAGYLGSEFVDDDNMHGMFMDTSPVNSIANCLSTSKNESTSINVPDIGSPDRSYISLNGCGNKDNHEVKYENGSAMVDENLESGIVPQPTAKEVIMLSSDDSNESLDQSIHSAVSNKMCVDSNGFSGSMNLNVSNSKPSTSETRQHKLTSITSIKSVTKHLSFTERLELYNSDPSLENTDDVIACFHRSQSSQDSIVISDDEINYSLNPNLLHEAFSGRNVDMHTQESIELSDSEDDHKEINSQVPESDIEERQSFLSLKMSDDSDCVSEKSLDLNFDDENFNSNHSVNEEDLINLSVKEMCQKEFVVGAAKPSTTKNFSRTVSDMTFERKNVRKNPTTPEKFIELSDDEFDEFDELVKGLKTPPWNKSIRHDDNDKLVKGGENSICDDLAMLDSTPSPTQPNEFIVQSMDQIYEVRTGVLVTPKPDYENMNSPTRLENLKKYGLKALTKRKAVICLEHIYNRLHPFIELDGHVDHVEDIFSQSKVPTIDADRRISNFGASQQPTSSTSNIPWQNNTESIVDSIVANNFDIIQESEGVFYLPSAPRAKKPWCLQPLHIAWHNLIFSNSKLYDQILQYKPVDIADIRSLFKSIDLRYETNDIISFLDRKCITFKTDNKRNNVVKKKNCV